MELLKEPQDIVDNNSELAGMAEDSVPEYINPEWDDRKLFNLVAANQDVLVRLGDTTTTVSEAITAHPGPWTPENEPNLISYVNQLLANRIAEEKPEEEKPDNDKVTGRKSNAGTGVQTVQKHTDSEDSWSQPQKEIGLAESTVQSSSKQKTSEPKGGSAFLAEAEPAEAPPAQKKSPQSSQLAEKAEVVTYSQDHSTDGADSGHRPKVAMVETVLPKAQKTSAPEPNVGKTDRKVSASPPPPRIQLTETKAVIQPEVETKQLVLALEVAEAKAVISPIVEDQPSTDRPVLAIEPEAKALTLPEIIEATPVLKSAEPVPTELSLPKIESAVISSEPIELNDAKLEAVEEQLMLTAPDDEINTEDPVIFATEEEVRIEHFAESTDQLDELNDFSNVIIFDAEESFETIEKAPLLQLNDEANFSEPTEIVDSEKPAKVAVGIEEIEILLTQMAKELEAGGAETPEEVDEILAKIIDMPARLEALDDENINTEAQAQEELEELFTKLLNELDIEYTPKTIKSLAYLMLSMEKEVSAVSKGDEQDPAPQIVGTHEIVKKLLASLNTVKKTANAGVIGKLALHPHSVNFSMFRELSEKDLAVAA